MVRLLQDISLWLSAAGILCIAACHGSLTDRCCHLRARWQAAYVSTADRRSGLTLTGQAPQVRNFGTLSQDAYLAKNCSHPTMICGLLDAFH